MLINVQFLRFAAAMLVVFYHTSSHVRDAGIDQGALFSLSEAIGFAGVDVFFVISGFIMAYTTHSSAGIADAWAFVRRRFARIYSGYWPFFLLALVLFAFIRPGHIEESSLLRSAILWPTRLDLLLITVSWTLIFEMFFYLLYTVLVIFSRSHRKTLLQLLLAFIMCWAIYSQFGRHAYDPGQLDEYMSLAEYYLLSPYMAEFLTGALVSGWLRHHAAGRPMIALTWLVLGVVLFLCAGMANNTFFDGHIEKGYYVLFRVFFFGVPSLLLLVGMVRLEQAGVRAPAGFSILVGGASYAIYLSHTLLLIASQHLGFSAFAGNFSAPLAQVLFLVLATLILAYSVAHYRFLERPLHGWFKRLLGIR